MTPVAGRPIPATSAELGLDDASVYLDRIAAFVAAADVAATPADLADAYLGQGRAYEKLGRFQQAQRHADEASSLYQEAGDRTGLALCRHTTAVWAFHHGDDERAKSDFESAAELRSDAGEVLLCAQSWHNLGYVLCRTGLPEAALASYCRSRLELEAAAQYPQLVAKAHRETGFLLSHLAYTNAAIGSLDEAKRWARSYFDHVSDTGVDREPILAYLAVAIVDGGEEAFRFAVEESHRQLLAYRPDDGRRPYLGARLLSLAQYSGWCLRNGRLERAATLLAQAGALATQRGWTGEAARLAAWHSPTA